MRVLSCDNGISILVVTHYKKEVSDNEAFNIRKQRDCMGTDSAHHDYLGIRMGVYESGA
ncbi:hypothetical protein GCM10008983_26030 [Lentibacillus halophilus]|uniref:Uncharacterized protein n=1 Tax=Lentibacillus halophilus TaxID=295065 RepID=A0ABN0ZGF0_9BACI